MHRVDFRTRSQNGNSSAIKNIFVDKYRMQSYDIFPLSNALFDDEAHCIILNFFPEAKDNSKHKNKCKVRLIVSETVSSFQE